MDAAAVGALFGVDGRTVSTWRRRYPDTPVPDAVIGPAAGWLPEREPEWRTWHATRPGQGKGGGRPRKRQPE